MAAAEDSLQKGVLTLKNIETNFGMEISSEKI